MDDDKGPYAFELLIAVFMMTILQWKPKPPQVLPIWVRYALNMASMLLVTTLHLVRDVESLRSVHHCCPCRLRGGSGNICLPSWTIASMLTPQKACFKACFRPRIPHSLYSLHVAAVAERPNYGECYQLSLDMAHPSRDIINILTT